MIIDKFRFAKNLFNKRLHELSNFIENKHNITGDVIDYTINETDISVVFDEKNKPKKYFFILFDELKNEE